LNERVGALVVGSVRADSAKRHIKPLSRNPQFNEPDATLTAGGRRVNCCLGHCFVDPSQARGYTATIAPRTPKKKRASAEVVCPFCGEVDELFVDLGGGERQVYTEDCAVCCRPRIVHVEPAADADGDVTIWLEREE
jgi:hypothetical protein